MTRKTLLILALVVTLIAGSGFGWLRYAHSQKPTIWVVVLEHHWEESIAQPEYSEGQLLKVYLSRYPKVEVRHRYFSDAATLRKWCGEIAEIDGSVILMFCGHGTPDGLYSEEDSIGYRAIAGGLGATDNVKVIHFSACSMFAGSFAYKLMDALDSPIPITGYSTDVDWTTSALVDLMFIDLLVNGESPLGAYQQTLVMMPIAGETKPPGSRYDALGFRILLPIVPCEPIDPITAPKETEHEPATETE